MPSSCKAELVCANRTRRSPSSAIVKRTSANSNALRLGTVVTEAEAADGTEVASADSDEPDSCVTARLVLSARCERAVPVAPSTGTSSFTWQSSVEFSALLIAQSIREKIS